ncbi:MAG: phosphoribosyltransferase family protein [Bacteroidota bacterium]
MFADRSNAGFKLVEKLREFEIINPLVLAIPNGGVETSLPIVDSLNSSFDLLIVEKLRLPMNPKSNFGSITEDGSVNFNDFEKFINHEEKMEIISKTKIEMRKKVGVYRSFKNTTDLKGRNVIIVDDGVNHGSTLQACITSCKKRKAASITIAVPVLSNKAYKELIPRVERIVHLIKPGIFKGLSSYYNNYKDISDEMCKKRLDMILSHEPA